MMTRDFASSLSGQITGQVRKLYDKYPYPNYPLMARFKWQDGYLSTSLFSSALSRDHFNASVGPAGQCGRVLLAGCGEILPYIIRKNEPNCTSMACVDLSDHSLRRARLRNLFTPGSVTYFCEDLNQFLEDSLKQRRVFDHIDSYGVLHHLPNPSGAIKNLAEALTPGGTMRIMVYNRRARRFIFHLQRALALMGLTPYSSADLALVRSFFSILARYAPILGEKLSQIGTHTLGSDARLVDTFLHPHEAQIDIEQWFDACSKGGLQPVAVFDRYAELDDLDNPMWQPPSWQQLEERAKDGRYENNLELFLTKTPIKMSARDSYSPDLSAGCMRQRRNKACRLKLMSPPSQWFGFEETKCISYVKRIKLWHHFIDHVYDTGREPGCTPRLESLLSNLPVPAIQRLARIGVIFRSQIVSEALRRIMMQPLQAVIELPQKRQAVDLQETPVCNKVKQILATKDRGGEKMVALVLHRLYEAQRGV